MYLLVSFIACIITSIVCNIIFYHRAAYGDMDVKWNDEQTCWDATMHISETVDFSKKKKLILKVNKK